MTERYGTAKRSLKYFEGKSRQKILAEPGVGSKTYAKIRRALFWRRIRRFFSAPFRYVVAAWGGIRAERAKSSLKRGKGGRKPIDRAIIIAIVLTLVLALLGLGLAVWMGIQAFRGEATPPPLSQGVGEATIPTISVEAQVTPGAEAPVVGEAVGVVYLRVETQRLDTQYGIWRRMPGVPVYLSPFGEEDAAPDVEREGTLRQVTEDRITTDGFKVAETTFTSAPGLYWVLVDEKDLPLGCAVWLPHFEEDSANQISVSSWKVVDLVLHGSANATVVKFQIICGKEVQPTTVGPTPTPSPSSTPVSPTPTSPPPTPTSEPVVKYGGTAGVRWSSHSGGGYAGEVTASAWKLVDGTKVADGQTAVDIGPYAACTTASGTVQVSLTSGEVVRVDWQASTPCPPPPTSPGPTSTPLPTPVPPTEEPPPGR